MADQRNRADQRREEEERAELDQDSRGNLVDASVDQGLMGPSGSRTVVHQNTFYNKSN